MKILETERLYFSPFKEDNFELLYKFRTSPEVNKFLHGGNKTIEEVRDDLAYNIEHQNRHGFSKWACFLKETNEFIGRAGLYVMEDGEVEVGYGFLPKYWSQGYATETLKALLKWAEKNINVERILAFAFVDNLASKRVIEKCGFTYYKQDIVNGDRCDLYYYNLTS